MNSKLSNIIAVDGLAATGKGTIARRLAAHLGYAYLDTGLLYRAVGLSVIVSGGDPFDPAAAIPAAQKLDPAALDALMDDPRLRSDVGGQAASKVGAIQGVRDALFQFQRNFALNPPDSKAGAVLDGRDIGTVIAPDAMVKIYVEATPEIRARRRFLELQSRGENVTESAVLEDLQTRDARDVSRSVVPAKPAEDAIHLDTTNLTIDEAVAAAIRIVEDRQKARS
ncbi:MAG: (d)CMP kinase [Proteobacteria bacterium]|jgi:cytidylate kinase|nr:(d)CMP kinase [Alphaproteobacteria bacterium]NCC03943.1 (d)CMP kinase [Pseudomonadota bacterium]